MTDGSVEERAPVLVLALGNLLLFDDAVGLRMLELLPREGPGVEYLDGGTQGLALLPYLAGRRAVVILDAVGLGAAAGTVHVLRGEDIDRFNARRAGTAHEGNALELLVTARMLGDAAGEVAVIGVEPERVATGIGLTPAVEAAVPAAVERARLVLREMMGLG